MSIVIRDVREHELDSVLALNNAAGPAILPLDAARLRHFHTDAEYFRVAERDGMLAGFLVGFGSDAAHDSGNFRWFGQRYPRFFYIDRIVVASRRRGGGVGRAFYADVQSYAELRYPQLACEVFLEQDSDPALLFHGSFGFREVGQHVMPGSGMPCSSMPGSSSSEQPDRRAAMLMKDLCSYPWVHDTYGEQLPDVPWLTMPRIQAPAHRATGT
ncbi:MAG TPA: GNAT family N-acetyltransferase [Luteimonas sp.]|nr:GNAT family N-acetyltransferase [Luteimonas sp.]